MIVPEETARRIAAALERLERVLERLEKPPMVAADALVDSYVEVQPGRVLYQCNRCIPSHFMDWRNPCKSHQPINAMAHFTNHEVHDIPGTRRLDGTSKFDPPQDAGKGGMIR